jgi:anti-sigma B factor antagonist
VTTLQISRSTEGEWAVITVTGEVDVATSPDLLAALEDERSKHSKLVIDLAGVTFIDSTGLGVMVQAKRTFDQEGSLRLVVAEANVKKVFEITGLDGVLRLFGSREEALAG